MTTLDFSSVLGESLLNMSRSSLAIEDLKQIQKVFINDLQTIERISIDEEYWGPQNIEIKYSDFEQPLIREKTKNILAAIEEEDEEFTNSISNQMATKTVQLAKNFLKNLALPLDDLKEGEKDETSRFSNQISFRSSKFNRMSHEFPREKFSIQNKSVNIERLSRLSVMASELENSNYFNLEKREVMMTNEKDFVEKNVMYANLLDLKSFVKFKSMNLSKKLIPLEELQFLTSKTDILTLMVDVSLDILGYIEDENILLEPLMNEVEFLKNKLLNYLELIKMSENYLKENIDTQTNYQQILYKKNPWIINLKKMASNLLNINNLISRILPIQNYQEINNNPIDASSNFFSIFEDYKNSRQVFYNLAFHTITEYFGIKYENKLSAEKVTQIVSIKLKKANLFHLREITENFTQLKIVLEEAVRLRAMILPLFFEEMENIVILINSYTVKYKNCFNIYQNFTLMANEVFCFRKNKILPIIIKLENFQEKFGIIFKNYTSEKAREILLRDYEEIKLEFKNSKTKSKEMLLKIQKNSFKHFPLIEFHFLLKDLKKAKGLMILGSDLFPMQQELQEKISFYNQLIKSSENIKAIQDDIFSLKLALNKYLFLFNEFNLILAWLHKRQNQLNIKDFMLKVQNSIELVKVNIECVGKVLKTVQMNENYENIVSIEEHESNLWIAKIHKIKKKDELKETPLELLNNIMDNLEKTIKKLEFLKEISFLSEELKIRIKKIIVNIEKNKIFLKEAISEKVTNRNAEIFDIDVKEIERFILHSMETIKNNNLGDIEDIFEKSHNFIVYLSDMINVEDYINNDEEKMVLCNELVSQLNVLIQLIKEKNSLENIRKSLNVENLQRKLLAKFSSGKSLNFVNKTIIMNNEFKNISAQLKMMDFLLLKEDYEQICVFLERLIKVFDKMEEECGKIKENEDSTSENIILIFRQKFGQTFEELKLIKNESFQESENIVNLINLIIRELLPSAR